MKYLGNVIALVLVVALIFGAIEFKKSNTYRNLRFRLDNFIRDAKHFTAVKKHNISMEVNPPKTRRVSFLKQQAELGEWMPDLFFEFSDSDWTYFWNLIYEPIKDKQGRFTVKRYRTRAEVETTLSEKYNSFSFLNSNTWDEFWGVAGVQWSN